MATTSTSINPLVLGVPSSSTPSTSPSSDTATTSTSATLVHSVSSTPTTPSATSTSTTPSATSTSTTPSATSTHTASASKPTSNGVSPGATAGIAVGCFLAGSLLALVLAFMWFRQRSTRRRGPRGGGLAHGTRSEKRKGSPSVEKHGVEVYAVAATHERNIDDILPHEADDKTIRQKVSTLLDQLELHVENFYTDVPVQIDPDTERQLSRFSTPLLSEPLAALLNSTNRPTTLIKHCLVFYVLNLTSSSAGSSGSLLPAQIVEMHRAVAKAQERDPLDSNTTFAFSRWRALTAFLRPEILSEKSLLDTAPGRAAVSDAVHVFSLAFHAWSSREHPDTERERHMANLLRSAVALRTWLFSQTSSFEFDWEPNVEPRERSSRVGVVVPGLLKTVDSKGVMLVRRVRILEGVVKRV